MNKWYPLSLLAFCAFGCSEAPESFVEVDSFGWGPYPVGSTNLEVAPEHSAIGDDAMHDVLLGAASGSDQPRFLDDILKYPQTAWVTDVSVPDDTARYGPASSATLPVVTFITYPSIESDEQRPFSFPYHDALHGSFAHMLGPGEKPAFADPDQRYPLVILAHGAFSHGIFDIRHAHRLSSHGYIVAVINYGDNRTARSDQLNLHLGYLRPLQTRAVLDSLLDSDMFGPHIDADRIGISGHSFGGFTALALAGGPFLGDDSTVFDPRIKASVIAAPWVRHRVDGDDLFAFGPNNTGLARVRTPVICLFGTKDTDTPASFILPAMRELSGPAYVIELVDQPHVFEQGSWEDRDNWELLFFSAYLKRDTASLALLKDARSMQGGNEDIQLFDYQQLAESD